MRIETTPSPTTPMLTLPDRHRNRKANDSTVTDQTALAIETAFNGRWHAWLSDTGRWWAARKHPLTAAALTAGCLPFLTAATPDQLTSLIRAQEELHANTNQK
jgi:hypothetical protein